MPFFPAAIELASLQLPALAPHRNHFPTSFSCELFLGEICMNAIKTARTRQILGWLFALGLFGVFATAVVLADHWLPQTRERLANWIDPGHDSHGEHQDEHEGHHDEHGH